MKKFGLLAALALAVVAAPGAQGDTVDVFNASGTFTDNSTFSGTISIDVTSGSVTAVDLYYFDPAVPTHVIYAQGPFTGDTCCGETPRPVDYEVDVPQFAQDPLHYTLQLAIKSTSAADSLVGYTGGHLCALTSECGPDAEGFPWVSDYISDDVTMPLFLNSGSLTLASSTTTGGGSGNGGGGATVPEPSTIALLGCAFLGIAGATAFRRSA
jgi:hypothetical protein